MFNSLNFFSKELEPVINIPESKFAVPWVKKKKIYFFDKSLLFDLTEERKRKTKDTYIPIEHVTDPRDFWEIIPSEEDDIPEAPITTGIKILYFYESNGVSTITTQRIRKTNLIVTTSEENEIQYKVNGRRLRRRVPLCRGGRK